MKTLGTAALATSIIAASVASYAFVLRSSHADLADITSNLEICVDLTCDSLKRASHPPKGIAIAYLRCSELATRRILTRTEAAECASVYLELKLSFLTDVSPEKFAKMTTAERFEANRQGYLYFLLWKAQDQESYELLRDIALAGFGSRRSSQWPSRH